MLIRTACLLIGVLFMVAPAAAQPRLRDAASPASSVASRRASSVAASRSNAESGRRTRAVASVQNAAVRGQRARPSAIVRAVRLAKLGRAVETFVGELRVSSHATMSARSASGEASALAYPIS